MRFCFTLYTFLSSSTAPDSQSGRCSEDRQDKSALSISIHPFSKPLLPQQQETLTTALSDELTTEHKGIFPQSVKRVFFYCQHQRRDGDTETVNIWNPPISLCHIQS
ncbi:hypothetical protein AOLI_G00288850 [Acnodon oligacanthus]